ncbi:MAG TPA: hypothetical protein VFJ58_04985 [Armatimonadota bacterium]|nr:hypothetical protein [Armatimonadota bacterium]
MTPGNVPDIRPFLRQVGAGGRRARDLSLQDARAAAACILDGGATPAQVGAFLIALRVKEETAEELAGFALAVRERRASIAALPDPTIDCASAYDGRVRTIPVGPAAALVAAADGVGALFHGVRGLGRAGLGPAETMAEIVPAIPGAAPIVYIDQTSYCPTLAALLPIRNQISLRTAFNTAEKLAAPGQTAAGDPPLLIGFFHGGFLERVAAAAKIVGVQRVMAVQGSEGSDEIPITRDSQVCELRDGRLQKWVVNLRDVGIEPAPASMLEIDPADTSKTFERLREALRGEPGPVREAIVMSAAARLYLADRAQTLAEGVALARRLLEKIRRWLPPGPTT